MDSLKQTQEFLISAANPFDSIVLQPLQIRPANINYTYEFLSDIDKNFEKYGYRNLGVDALKVRHADIGFDTEQGTMIWENDFTNFLEVKKMVKETQDLMNADKTFRLTSHYNFYLAGVGVDLYDNQNKSFNEIDWHFLDKVKFLRAKQYKKLLFNRCGISAYTDAAYKNVTTFGEWIETGNTL
jgi:hypothetical protein